MGATAGWLSPREAVFLEHPPCDSAYHGVLQKGAFPCVLVQPCSPSNQGFCELMEKPSGDYIYLVTILCIKFIPRWKRAVVTRKKGAFQDSVV